MRSRTRWGRWPAMVFLLWAAAAAGAQDLPKGWVRAGLNPGDYEMSVDPKGGADGGPCARIKSKPDARAFGTLMQTFDAAEYRGKRVRLSASVRSAEVAGWAGLWMRVDGTGPRGPAPLAFDNMQDRPIKATTGWKRYEVVLEVAPDAATVNFGLLLAGAGEVWLDRVRFEAVGADVPVTVRTLPSRPVNLDFSQR